MTATQQLVMAAFDGLAWQPNHSLAAMSYFKLGGAAELYVELSDLEVLKNLILFCHQHQVRCRVVGGLSNVIVADEGVEGVLVRLVYKELSFGVLESNSCEVVAGAGIKMATLVSETVAHGLTGLEYFLGVPGMLGGAVFNNAHYLADLISKHIRRVRVITPQGELKWLDSDACDFGYDHSRFQTSGEVIVAVEFRLNLGDKATSNALIAQATTYRAQTQPLGMPSSGCIFQNVPITDELRRLFPQFADKSHVPGGFLIDQAGLKGSRVGQLEVSHKHAAFIVNHGGGTAHELLQLIEVVKQRVAEKFAVQLHEEVFFLS